MKSNDAIGLNLEHFDDFYKNRKEKGRAIITSHYSKLFSLFLALLPKNSLILDHGCGTGFITQLLIFEGHRVDCVDISPEAIKKCKMFFDLSGFSTNQYTLITEDFLNFAYPVSKYNGVIDHFSLHFVPYQNQKEILKLIYRALRPGGIFYLSVMLSGSIKIKEPHSREREDGSTLLKIEGIESYRCFYLWNPYKIRAVLSNIGFKVIEFHHPMTSIYFILQKEK